MESSHAIILFSEVAHVNQTTPRTLTVKPLPQILKRTQRHSDASTALEDHLEENKQRSTFIVLKLSLL